MTDHWLYVSVGQQRMYYYCGDFLESIYVISTASCGINQQKNSEGTPLGLHKIADKIGDHATLGTVFVGRKNTGKLFHEYRDWQTKGYVTSRIMRLMGLQNGINFGGECDTYERYIYIHGIADEKKIGRASTRGCIGMLNQEIIELFKKIKIDSLVLIAVN